MRKAYLTLIIILALPTISKSQKSIEIEYQICIKALDFIKAKDTEGLKGLIYKNAFKNTTEEQFEKWVNDFYDIVVGVENPTMDMVLLMTSISQYNGQNANIYSLGFPFLPMSRRDDERGVQLVFIFSKEIKKNKIIGWKIRDFGASLTKQAEGKNIIPTLEKFDFKTKNIIEFRIVYKEKTSTESHFEISGDSTELNKLNIKTKLDEIFSIINESKIEKKDDTQVRWLRDHPNLELDVLQFRFSNYDNIFLPGIFEIANIVSEDPEISKDYSGYIVVHHAPFRYFISTKDNVAIVDKIIELRKMTIK